MIDAAQAEALIAQAREHGVELLGEQGLLRQMTKAVLERALAEELTEHLGYEIGDPAGQGSGNSSNGYTPKTLLTDAGTVDLEVPIRRSSHRRMTPSTAPMTRDDAATAPHKRADKTPKTIAMADAADDQAPKLRPKVQPPYSIDHFRIGHGRARHLVIG